LKNLLSKYDLIFLLLLCIHFIGMRFSFLLGLFRSWNMDKNKINRNKWFSYQL
jgi:hypothetical protein